MFKNLIVSILLAYIPAAASLAQGYLDPDRYYDEQLRLNEEVQNRTKDWPSTLRSSDSFDGIGKAISREPMFPFAGTDVDKARFVMTRLPDIVSKYGLETGSGGLTSNLVIQAGRFFDRFDPESNGPIKLTGDGNCAEFSMFFQDVLRAAGVHSQVFYGDKNPDEGHSMTFAGTDTAVYVNETLPNGKTIRRVFDAFRAVYHHQQAERGPWSNTIASWSDKPMTQADKRPGEQDVWLEKLRPVKKYVKGQDQKLLPPATDPRTPKNFSNYVGIYQRDDNPSFKMRISSDGTSLSAVWVKHPLKTGSPVFVGARNQAGTAVFSTEKGYAYAESDCPGMKPFVCPAKIEFVTAGKALTFSSRPPKYWSKTAKSHTPCSWALDQPRSEELTRFVRTGD